MIFFQVIAKGLSEEEIAGLKEIFKMMDTDNSGAITFDELKAGLERLGSGLADSEIRSIMEAVSVRDRCKSSLWFRISGSVPHCSKRMWFSIGGQSF